MRKWYAEQEANGIYEVIAELVEACELKQGF